MNAHSPNPPTSGPITPLDADGKLKSDRPCGPGRLFCLRCREARRPAFDEVEFCRPALGSLRGLCLTCIGVMHHRTLVARFAAAATDLQVSFSHRDPSGPPTIESREFASVVAQMRSAV